MGFFGRIFGSDKALGKIVDGVSSGLDKLVYTAEEKATDKQRLEELRLSIVEKQGEQMVEWQKATQGQNLARRGIAVSVVGCFLGAFVVATVLNAVGAVWDSQADHLLASAEAIHQMVAELDHLVWLICLFYFGAPHMGTAIDKIADRFSRRKAAPANA